MERDELLEYCEMAAISKKIIEREGHTDYVNFLLYCFARLNTGDSVQAIWSDYLAKAR